ncbi:MAG TPA: hypothetical protein PLU44_16860 [Candidatus Krumholzibacteria bacterium]|nr:hypothetical protein [Candidatus Krumholzibacteria bacterium]
MAYCVAADVQLYVPQAGAVSVPEDFAEYIAAAQVHVDAILGEGYEVPFADGEVDPLVKDLTAQLAAGRYLAARHATKGPEEHAYARSLINDATSGLNGILASPSRIANAPKEPTVDETGGVMTEGDRENSIFDMDDPTGWGTRR